MNRMELVIKQWDHCYDKEDWYPPLADVLRGVTAEQAAWRPEGGPSNSIWENVKHLIYYKKQFLARLRGEESGSTAGTNDDTFAVETGSVWERDAAELESVHRAVRAELELLDEADFDREVPRHPLGLWAMSLVMHDAYHTGEIAFLRKLQGTWPARRSFE